MRRETAPQETLRNIKELVSGKEESGPSCVTGFPLRRFQRQGRGMLPVPVGGSSGGGDENAPAGDYSLNTHSLTAPINNDIGEAGGRLRGRPRGTGNSHPPSELPLADRHVKLRRRIQRKPETISRKKFSLKSHTDLFQRGRYRPDFFH
jgi:hypothetical protein